MLAMRSRVCHTLRTFCETCQLCLWSPVQVHCLYTYGSCCFNILCARIWLVYKKNATHTDPLKLTKLPVFTSKTTTRSCNVSANPHLRCCAYLHTHTKCTYARARRRTRVRSYMCVCVLLVLELMRSKLSYYWRGARHAVAQFWRVTHQFAKWPVKHVNLWAQIKCGVYSKTPTLCAHTDMWNVRKGPQESGTTMNKKRKHKAYRWAEYSYGHFHVIEFWLLLSLNLTRMLSRIRSICIHVLIYWA